uniref:HTH CENPB-type domain-containing protein n=1 Tax=Takifugu rubripes TaxID=31033 RepID=A0A674NL54_TAKRU
VTGAPPWSQAWGWGSITSDNLEKSGSKIGQVNRQLRRSYDANFKMMVINEAESSNNCKAAVKYGVTECNVRRWRAQKDGLKNAHSQRKAFRGPQSGRFQELDRRVCAYVDEKRKDGMPISRAVIQLKAVEIARELNIPTAEFRASLGWWKRMMRRNGLTLRRRTSLAQRLPSDSGELLSFQRYIGNADQTPAFFDMPTPVTVHKKGEKSVIIKSTGNEKSRVTVMLACLADGTKLPPYVVLKRKTVPNEAMPAGIIVRAQEKGWMETELVVDWLKVVWGRRRGGLRKKRNMRILDAFLIIPGGMTSQLQVLDVVVNKPFKDNLPKKYTEWLLSGDHALTPTGEIQKPPVRLLCEWILHAWDAVSPKSIIHGFKKCCLSNALDGSEDDLLWEEPEDGSEE